MVVTVLPVRILHTHARVSVQDLYPYSSAEKLLDKLVIDRKERTKSPVEHRSMAMATAAITFPITEWEVDAIIVSGAALW